MPMVQITVKPEPIEFENSEENLQIEFNQDAEEVQEEELWIKTEPVEDDSQDSIKEEDQGTLSENEAKSDEGTQNGELNRNRQSNAPSRKQVMVFLDFLNEHRELANCMLRGPTGRVKAHQLWEDIAEKLNKISGCHKTTQQWQRVWSDKKYLTRKAAAVRYASMSGGLPAPDLTPQDEKILAIIGEPIPPRRVGHKPATPEPKPHTPKQSQEVLISVPPKRGPAKPEQDPQQPNPVEGFVLEVEVPSQPSRPPRKPYTPRKAESLGKEVARKSDTPKTDMLSTPVIPPDVLSQPDVLEPPDEFTKAIVQGDEDQLPSPSITDPPSPAPTPPESRQTRVRRASLDPYTKKFIHLKEERLKNDSKRNTELSKIRLSLQQGTAELTEIRKVMQEMLGLMKQFTKRD